MKHGLVLSLILASILAPRSARSAPIFAIVVGVNRPLDPGTPTLLYADDDAILFHKLLSRMGRSQLLIDPDEGTRRLHGSIAGALSPTRENLRRAMEGTLAAVEAARSRGERPQLFFIYSGHGDVKNNEGYLALADGRLTATDLDERLLSRSRAETNHVIVDACKSYFIVHEKRAGGTRQPVGQPFSRTSGLARRFPNTGFLLSTSSGSSSHEWEEFQAGIFSHEVRSGLLGAADMNRDGQVSYNEMRAFIEVANGTIPNDRFRPHIFVRAPGNDGSRALLRVRPHHSAAITVPPARAGRYFLEDSKGVRLADLHSDGSAPVTLAMLADGRLYFHDLDRSVEYLVDARPGQRQIAALPSKPSSYRVKGAAHEAFTQIFKRPFGLLAYREAICQFAEEDPAPVSLECVECQCRSCAPRPSGQSPSPQVLPPTVILPSPRGEEDRALWERTVAITLGTPVTWRSLTFTDPLQPKNPPNARYGPFVALAFGGEIYPGAFLHRHPWANLGLTVGYTRSLDVKTSVPGLSGAEVKDTTWQRLELRLKYRWNLVGRLNSPTLRAGLGWGRESFTIDWGNNTTPVLPDVTYSYLKLSFLELEVPFFQRPSFGVGLDAGFHYLKIFSAGEIESTGAAGYGPATTHGIEAGAGLFFRLRWVFFKAGVAYRRFWHTFDRATYNYSSPPPGSSTDSERIAGGALETYAAFNILAGFAY
jgi:hypothetical protein